LQASKNVKYVKYTLALRARTRVVLVCAYLPWWCWVFWLAGIPNWM